MYSSFFGGRMGAFVVFPGPNNEDWGSAEIVAPIKSPSWEFKTTRIIQPLPVTVEWEDPEVICPSLKLQRATLAQIRVEEARPRKRKS